MKYALKSIRGLADVGVLHGDEDGPRIPPRCLEAVREKFQLINLIIPNNFFYMNYALNSVPGLADVGVPHGYGDGPRTPARCLEGARKKFQMTNFTMPNNSCFMKCALKLGPGLADVGVLHGDGDGPRAPPICQAGPEKFSHF